MLLIFENYDYSGGIFEDNDNALTLMIDLNMPEINKKVFHLILLNIFNEIIFEKNTEYFNNGKPNKEFFINNYEKFNLYMEFLTNKEYENKQNAIFIKIYYISFVKIYIFYISEIYSKQNLFEQFDGLKDISFIYDIKSR